MGKNAAISWLHPPGGVPGATWSPWHGCTAKHPGCANCWATAMNHRWGHDNFGKGKPRRITAESGWRHPMAWARAAARASKRRLVSPLDCDPLDAEVYERSENPFSTAGALVRQSNGALDVPAGRETVDRFVQLIRDTGDIPGSYGVLPGGGLTWLLLTKRPENWRWIPEDVRRFCWLLYSASDQATLDAGMPHLLEAEGFAGLGLSLEPLVGPIDLASPYTSELFDRLLRQDEERGFVAANTLEDALPGLRWVILGGESGTNARPCDVAWIRDLVRQCRESGVSPWVKQTGANLWENGVRLYPVGAGTDLALLPEDLRVQEFPEGLR
jgi:hypothetical protein